MDKAEFEHILAKAKSGTPFKATVKQDGHVNQLEGVLHIGFDQFWLCFNEGLPGNDSPNKHGYHKSWVIENDNRHNILEFSLEVPKRDVTINNYEIY